MKQERINAFAKEQGYSGAEYLCEWHGYSCYEPYFDSDDSTEIQYVGLPLVIMVKGNEIRMSTADECMKINM